MPASSQLIGRLALTRCDLAARLVVGLVNEISNPEIPQVHSGDAFA